MTNEEWIRFLDTVKPAAREDVDFVRAHFGETTGSMLGAVLDMLGTIESKQDTVRHGQEGLAIRLSSVERLWADHLTQLHGEIDAVLADMKLLRAELHSALANLLQWRAEVEAHIQRIDDLHDRLLSVESRVTVVETRLDARPTPEEAHATYTGVQQILTHLELGSSGG